MADVRRFFLTRTRRKTIICVNLEKKIDGVDHRQGVRMVEGRKKIYAHLFLFLEEKKTHERKKEKKRF